MGFKVLGVLLFLSWLAACGLVENNNSVLQTLSEIEEASESEEKEDISGILARELCTDHESCKKICRNIYQRLHSHQHCEALTVGQVAGLKKLFETLSHKDPVEQKSRLQQTSSETLNLYLEAGLNGLQNHIPTLIKSYDHPKSHYINLLQWIVQKKGVSSTLKKHDLHNEVLKTLIHDYASPRGQGLESLSHLCMEPDFIRPCSPPTEDTFANKSICGCKSNNIYLKASSGELLYKLSTVQEAKVLTMLPALNTPLITALSFIGPPQSSPVATEVQTPSPEVKTVTPLSSDLLPFNFILFASRTREPSEALSMSHSLLQKACHSEEKDKTNLCVAGFYCWLKGQDSSSQTDKALLQNPSLLSPEVLNLIFGEDFSSPRDDCQNF